MKNQNPEIRNRTVVHLDLDTFFVSVERLLNSSLVGMPILVGGFSDRAVVSSCSYETRRYGIHSGMPMKMARRLCPDAIVIRGDSDEYTRYSRLVTEVIADRAPVFEKASIDEHYLDITGMDRFFGSLKWTRELRQAIMHETGLPISFGLSVNKTVSKIATNEAKPNGELQIAPPEVRPFLSPLSIRKMPMIGQQTFRLLRSMGVSTIGTLGDIPPEMLERVLGKNGRSLWKRANGIDNTPVAQYSERKSIGTERTFEQDTTDVAALKAILTGMVGRVTFDLRKKRMLASVITVKIRYSNFDTHTLQRQIPYTSFDHVILPVVRDLFDRLYSRRMLIRLIGVRLSGLVGGQQQLDLFEESPEMVELYQAMDRMRLRYGKYAVMRAVNLK